jgi:hypothetical protein
MAKPYEGYPSWNSWNVSLWINNEYNLYKTAYDLVQREGMDKAVRILTNWWVNKRTPDGGVFNRRSIKLALEGMDE